MNYKLTACVGSIGTVGTKVLDILLLTHNNSSALVGLTIKAKKKKE